MTTHIDLSKLSKADIEKYIAALKQENAALKVTARSRMNIKVSEKKAVSVTGVGRFPATFYAPQWLKLLDMADDIRSFINEHRDELSWTKGDKDEG